MKRKNIHDVSSEPIFQPGAREPNANEARIAERIRRKEEARLADSDVEHSVWDEVVTEARPELVAGPQDRAYAKWLEAKCAAQGTTSSMVWMVLLALSAGPLAIATALFEPTGAGRGLGYGVFLYIFIGPAVEEVAKVLLATWTVERRPYRFIHGSQILACAVMGGFVFAVIENVFYLKLYIEDPSELTVLWRWTVCVALHTGCSAIAGTGLWVAWRRAMAERRRARLQDAYPYLLTAIVAHGVYNLFAILLALTGLFE